jgi:hypothetical protein
VFEPLPDHTVRVINTRVAPDNNPQAEEKPVEDDGEVIL